MKTLKVDYDSKLLGLTTITLNRPRKLNAINPTMHRELQALCQELQEDAETRVVILTGAGRAFSAGHDLTAKVPKARSDLQRRLQAGLGNKTSHALESLDAVTIGAINGLAVGGAVVFASCCDMRLAAESAWFWINEVDLRVPLTWNALPRLMREIGPARTKELVMTCDRFSSEQALRWGFLNRVCPDDGLISEARSLAAKLLAKDPLALAVTKTTTRALANQMVPSEGTQADRELILLSGGILPTKT